MAQLALARAAARQPALEVPVSHVSQPTSESASAPGCQCRATAGSAAESGGRRTVDEHSLQNQVKAAAAVLPPWKTKTTLNAWMCDHPLAGVLRMAARRYQCSWPRTLAVCRKLKVRPRPAPVRRIMTQLSVQA